MNFRESVKRLGSFEIGSKLRVTDPCYEPDIWCAGTLEAVDGTWEAGFLTVDNAVAVLAARHTDCPLPLETATINAGADARSAEDSKGWAVPDFKVCVDSGQAGLFDDAGYQARNGKADEGWYRKICDTTCSDAMAGVFGDGVASRAGYGDGGYLCVYHKNEDNLADFVFLMFMDDEGNEEL